VLFYTFSFGFCHTLISSPKATDCKLSSDQVVFIDALHCSGYCFHQRGGFGVLEMFINHLFNHSPIRPASLRPVLPHTVPYRPTSNNPKD
ncbi:unnamed protein product, partial [Hymenolepis diminuta]